MATKLGDKLRALRKKNGSMTLDKLAATAGMSKSYLWELENRDSPRPSAEKLAALATILGVTTDFLLDDTVDEPEQRHVEDAFFRSYSNLQPEDKETIRRIVESFRKDV